MSRNLLLASITLLVAGCPPMAPSPEEGGIIPAMREACPQLSDEVLEGFILAITGLKDNGLGEAEAAQEWVDGCQFIPSDGNFGGDQQACADCLRVLVAEIYRD